MPSQKGVRAESWPKLCVKQNPGASGRLALDVESMRVAITGCRSDVWKTKLCRRDCRSSCNHLQKDVSTSATTHCCHFLATIRLPLQMHTLSVAQSSKIEHHATINCIPPPTGRCWKEDQKMKSGFCGSTFQGCEYLTWATIHLKVNRKSGFHLLFLLPKSSFGGAQIAWEIQAMSDTTFATLTTPDWART